jgi:hypothetical protein
MYFLGDNMKKISVLMMSALVFASPVMAAGKHEHGVGQMDIVVEGDVLEIELELPLDTLVGFERAPKNDKQKAALAAALETLRKVAVSPALTSGPGCTLEKVEVDDPFGEPADKGDKHDHEDVDVDYRFRCAAPNALVGIDTTIFKSFPRLYRLEVQRVGPKKAGVAAQGGARLTPKKPELRW